MSIDVEAVYENGMLILDRLLPLDEHQRVRVIVQEELNAAGRNAAGGDWWQTLQDILADQEKRGFVGTVTEVDRDHQDYEERTREILGNTTHRGTGG